jgi:glycosyltransferase involved in cell wall biosynthesis
MKLLVFAHTPPPHHGQSYMVSLMLEGLGGDRRQAPAGAPAGEVECYHVNARYSDHLEEIGAFRWEKALLLLRYCAEAIWCRLKYGVRAFYYVPAPGKRAALYRDWMVMLLCRPFFAQFIHHWHAVGLGDWLAREGFWWERWLTHRLLGAPALGLALAIPSMRDALWFRSGEVEIIPNGIPDPCPNAETEVIPAREKRLRARCAGEPGVFRVLYLAHCTAEKGLFDAIGGVRLLASQLAADRSPLRVHLTVAGEFLRDDEKARFMEMAQQPGFAETVTYAGFVSGAEKTRLLAESDGLCFPTYYHAEALPVVIVEALAAALPVVTTRWRGIPEILPPEHAAFVPARSPEAIAERLRDVMLGAGGLGGFGALRRRFTERFVTARYLESLRVAFRNAAAREHTNA